MTFRSFLPFGERLHVCHALKHNYRGYNTTYGFFYSAKSAFALCTLDTSSFFTYAAAAYKVALDPMGLPAYFLIPTLSLLQRIHLLLRLIRVDLNVQHAHWPGEVARV